ncbi:hypothetical protein RKD48_000062 [Streptomyces ambofaciens]
MTIRRLVVFGGTGDLTGRYLLPALAALYTAGHLDERFILRAASREDWDGARYREWADGQLARHGTGFPGRRPAGRHRVRRLPQGRRHRPRRRRRGRRR